MSAEPESGVASESSGAPRAPWSCFEGFIPSVSLGSAEVGRGVDAASFCRLRAPRYLGASRPQPPHFKPALVGAAFP